MCSVDLCGTAYCKFTIPRSKTWTPKSPKCRKFHGKLQVWAVQSWWNSAQSPCTACKSPYAAGLPERQQQKLLHFATQPNSGWWTWRHHACGVMGTWILMFSLLPLPSPEWKRHSRRGKCCGPAHSHTAAASRKQSNVKVGDPEIGIRLSLEFCRGNMGKPRQNAPKCSKSWPRQPPDLRLVDDLAAPASSQRDSGMQPEKTRRLRRLRFHHARSCCDVLAACHGGNSSREDSNSPLLRLSHSVESHHNCHN